ncbi:MAG: helix-turn-helix domain-containing protein [Deltaproteobacteria bacterium]|nr:helix-turn-helix domain-containing protein [Deltaproteobacteria bacterium]
MRPGTISAAILAGDLPAYRPGKRNWRIFREDLEAWLRTLQGRADQHALDRVRAKVRAGRLRLRRAGAEGS